MESEGNTDKNYGVQTVTPVGNAWVMSRSKSYSGRVYYFNTLTGEAVWNLSKEEIEKAKKRTAKLPLQSENYPEPQEPPCDPSNHDSYQDNTQQSQLSHYIPPKVYNNQIINHEFTTPQYQPCVAPCQNCTSMNAIPNIVGIRPNMWIHPPPIFFSNPGTSLTNINRATENVSHHNCFDHDFTVQNTSVSLSRRFSFGNKRSGGGNFTVRPHGVGKFTPRKNKFSPRKPFVPKKPPCQNVVSDLRTIITGKKSGNETLKESQETNSNTVQDTSLRTRDINKSKLRSGRNSQAQARIHNNKSPCGVCVKEFGEVPVSPKKTSQESVTSPPKLESKIVEDDLIVNTDDEWLKNNGTIDGAKLKLDVTILKNLATENSDCECWYIVVDKNVLMQHFTFLNVLTTSDGQCKLMVVREVLSALQAAARCDASKDGPRKVLRGLSQMFAAKLAVIAEYSFRPNEIKDCTGMINFCLMLRQQNERMILLSNEETLQKNTTNIPILTIQNVKELLTSNKYDQVKIISPVIERNIKITIPNDIQSCEPSTPDDDRETGTLHANTIPVQECSPKTCNTERNTRETNVQTEDVIPTVRKMVDAEVQTEPSLELTELTPQKDTVGVNTDENITELTNIDRVTNIDECFIPKNSTIIIGQNNDEIKSQESNTRTSPEEITKELRLKRSTSIRSISNDANKKHFKWHRKRKDGSVGCSDSNSSLEDRISSNGRESNISTEFEINSYAPQISNKYDTMYPTRSESTQMYYSDFGEGSENSSVVLMRKEASENILIEETSTSATDVISNSASNVGSEGTHEINKSKEQSNPTNYEVQNKAVMFEITTKEMEQNLKMRRDEWLAEFIQIMEEVLTQVLQINSEDIVKAMPPPWTLHEATECIKRTFIGDCDVFDAASRLSQVLHTMSDIKGKIKIDFKPNEFMELYSYGVYLVDSLQTILDKCQDLQIASESLAKLLKNIESPISEGGPNDSFGDITEVSANVSLSCSEEAANQENASNVSNKIGTPRKSRKRTDPNCNKSPGTYNLRSNSKTKPSEEKGESPAVKFIRKINIHNDFFKSLHLLRKDETAKHTVNVSNKTPVKLADNTVEDNITLASEAIQEKPEDKGPKIIRNFNIVPNIEEKLKKQHSEPLDFDKLDYSMDYNDYEYDNLEEAYSEVYDPYMGEANEECIENKEINSAEEATADTNNNSFKMLVSDLMQEIKETTVNVYSFCKTTHDEILSKDMQYSRRIEIHDKAQKANAHIQNICNSFRRIQEENINQNGHGVQSRLKEAGILLNDREVTVYWNMIGSCIEQGDTLLESINTIIEALKT